MNAPPRSVSRRDIAVLAGVLALIAAILAVTHKSPTAWAAECTRLAAHPDERLATGGVPISNISVAEARTACRTAVEKLDRPELHYRYGRALTAGTPTDADKALAFRHAQIAYDRQWAMAAVLLANIHADGRGVPLNPDLALRLLEPAIDRSVPSALWLAASIELRQAGNAARQERGVALMERAGAGGAAGAYAYIGDFFLRSGNPRRAIAAYAQADAAGEREGAYGLGMAHNQLRQYVEAAQHYQRAANLGLPGAQSALAFYFYQGRGGLRQSHPDALAWALRASQGGERDGQYLAGYMYFHAEGVAKDALTAERHLQLAVAQNHTEARRLYEQQVRPFATALRQMPSGSAVGCVETRTSAYDRNFHEYFNRCSHRLNTQVCSRFLAGEIFSLFDGRNRETCTVRQVPAQAYIDSRFGADENSSILRIAISQSHVWIASCYFPLTPRREGNQFSCVQ
ncbi:tetratricopeptide repeat protein [Humitalea sp. 24SJ18S-53]|uniref:tetratricopeptide repeat protein n=1 Tax=Humitalea sp. 24SJ18S-53 TaxID=3422307 RepID=UPI003D6731D4